MTGQASIITPTHPDSPLRRPDAAGLPGQTPLGQAASAQRGAPAAWQPGSSEDPARAKRAAVAAESGEAGCGTPCAVAVSLLVLLAAGIGVWWFVGRRKHGPFPK